MGIYSCFCVTYGCVLLYFREFLWKLFYPADYQNMVPSTPAESGQIRQFKSFDFRMNILAETTIDILFTKSKVRVPHTDIERG